MLRSPCANEPDAHLTVRSPSWKVTFALHDEKRFIFTRMNMRGRSVIRRYARFAERINATGLFSGGQNAINISDARIGGALPGAGMDGFG